MKKYIKTRWHEFWYKYYHLPRSVRGMKIVNNKTDWVDKEYHAVHFAKAWYHAQEYQKLDPVGMKEFSDVCLKKAFGSKD